MSDLDKGTLRLLSFFEYATLHPDQQGVGELLHRTAYQLARGLPPNPERTKALNELLNARDWAIRSVLP
jgi:hypothetical protein